MHTYTFESLLHKFNDKKCLCVCFYFFLENNSIILEKSPIINDVEATLRDIRTTLQRTKTLLGTDQNPGLIEYIDQNRTVSPIWIPRLYSIEIEIASAAVKLNFLFSLADI